MFARSVCKAEDRCEQGKVADLYLPVLFFFSCSADSEPEGI
jgi:hypothetical protein